MHADPYIFYGIELSLYAGKLRSYLRKKKLPFVTRSTAHPGFDAASAQIGRSVQPLIETPEGEIIQDTTEIIDFLERRHPEPSVYPTGPCQRLVSLLLELYGDEGLIKPAMHYRWNFPEQNDAFLFPQFAEGLAIDALGESGGPDDAAPTTPDQMVDLLQQGMRNHVIRALGVTRASATAIEAGYEELLDRLEVHFRTLPYLLGGRPSIGDFGMIAPLYAHLGRDPYPASLMKRRSPSCYRWVERMNVEGSGTGELFDLDEDFPPKDEIPDTLVPILQLVSQDFMPELLSLVSSVDDWLADHPEVSSGTPVPASTAAMGTGQPLGTHTYSFRDVEIEGVMRHYSLWMLGRVHDHYDRLESEERRRADELLVETGLAPLIGARTALRIGRRDFREVFV